MLLLKPELYTAPTASGEIFLKGGRCVCSFTFFPLQAYGCEQCGAVGKDLHAMNLRGKGHLVASAVVHMHAGEGRKAPFVVASIQLDDGPVVRTLLDCDPGAPTLDSGIALIATLIEIGHQLNEDGVSQPLCDLRFRPVFKTVGNL